MSGMSALVNCPSLSPAKLKQRPMDERMLFNCTLLNINQVSSKHDGCCKQLRYSACAGCADYQKGIWLGTILKL